ncbi:MAG: hypothetical protein KC910_34825, partial [Candidatus Eremiobacteraeota bacterium]|nr:hypothetical protein [Candidatus Eremiobacteraeota bacterium]
LTGVISVKLNPPEGEVVVPLAGAEELPPVQREYHLSPDETQVDAGEYFNEPPLVAGGGPGDMDYITYEAMARW